MNHNDDIEVVRLQQELESACTRAELMKNRFSKTRQEIQFYQGLLWSILACGVMAAIASLLHP